MFIEDYGYHVRENFYPNGKIRYRIYLLHGRVHREDGPAFNYWRLEGSVYDQAYYLHGGYPF